MPTILGEFVRVPLKALLILSAVIPLAAVAVTPPSQMWSAASRDSQLAALDYIERLEVARSAGPQAAADALGIENGFRANSASASGIARNFGDIALLPQLEQRSGQVTIVVKASGGCIERDVAKARLLLGKIVRAPSAYSPAPVVG